MACILTTLTWVPMGYSELVAFRIFQNLEGDQFRGEFFPLRQLVMKVTPGLRWILIWHLTGLQNDAARIVFIGVCGVASVLLIWFCLTLYNLRRAQPGPMPS